ncbi:MAG: hypothetical protein ACRYGR_07040 [Janthinobacterium lividum]
MLYFVFKNKPKMRFKILFFGLFCLISSLQASERMIPKEDLPFKKIRMGLSIDGVNGSGTLNYLPALLLEELEKHILDDHKVQLHRVFDYMGGTSFGGILSLALAHGILASEQVVMFEDKKQRKLLLSERQDHDTVIKFFKEKFGESTFDDLKIPVLLTGCSTDQIPYCCSYEKNIPKNGAYLYNTAYHISRHRSYGEVFNSYPNSIIPNNRLFRKNQADFLKTKMEERWPNAEINILSLGTGITCLEPSWFSPVNASHSDVFLSEDEKSDELEKIMGKNFTRIDYDVFKNRHRDMSYLRSQAECQIPKVVKFYEDNQEKIRHFLEKSDKK